MPLYEGLSYGAEKNAVVFDIGIAYTKCGFAGDTGPRCIIPSEVKRRQTNKLVKIHCCTDSDERYGALVDFIHVLYFRHLLVNPKERRVVVVESMLTPTVFRDTLAKVLFKHYEVPSLLFAPTHLMSLFTLGVTSGMVMDIGLAEAVVIPIYESIPIVKAWQTIPLAAKAIHSNLENALKESATVRSDQQIDKPVTDELNESILEDIKVRCCFVTNLSRAKQIQAVHQGRLEESKAPTPPPDVDYPIGGSKVLHIPGKLREHTCEVLFEQDNEQRSVATLLLDALIKCPVDMRRPLAENLVLIGGTSMLPGFKHRLLSEIHDLVETPKYKEELYVKIFKLHNPPSKENFTAWLGGSIFGALEILGARSVSRDAYQQNQMIPDWCSLYEEEKDAKTTVSKKLEKVAA